MKKEEALALGVPEDKIREFQDIYSRDLTNRMKHQKYSGTRAAIAAILPLIQGKDSLQKILETVSHVYVMEARSKGPKQEGENENQDIVCP